MIELVTLTAKHFYGNGKSRAIVDLSDWISNGHWSIQRPYVTNERAINPVDFHDNFKRPHVEIFNGFGSGKLSIILWSAVTMNGGAIDDTVYLKEVTADKARLYTVTNWILKLKDKDVRLLCEPIDNSPRPMVKGDDGVWKVPDDDTGIELPDYHCFIDEIYIDALGLQADDTLTGVLLSTKGTFLVTSDLSRCAMSVSNVDSDIEQLPFITLG